MKILVISYTLAPGGAERFCVDLCNALASEENELVLLTTNDDSCGSNSFYLPDLTPAVKYVNIKGRSGHSLRSLFAISRIIRLFRPDIVHSNTDLIQLLLPVLFDKRPKYVHTIHSIADFYLPSHLHKPFYRWIYKNSVVPVTLSEACSLTYNKLYRLSNDVVIRNGRVRPGLSPEYLQIKEGVDSFRAGSKLFIHIARYAAPKNQQVLFDAFKLVDGARLLVLGGGYPRELMQAQDPERVMFVGQKQNVGDYLACADFFVLSSLFEGIPLSLLEAMSFGLVPVSTPAGGVVDIIRDSDNGYLSNGFDAQELAGTMLRAMTGSVSGDLVKAEYEKYYSMSVCAQKYLSLFNDLLQ